MWRLRRPRSHPPDLGQNTSSLEGYEQTFSEFQAHHEALGCLKALNSNDNFIREPKTYIQRAVN